MTATLVLSESVAAALSKAARQELETAGVLLARVVPIPTGELRLLCSSIRWVDDAAYLRREADGLRVASSGYVPALAEAETLGALPIWVHTHPGRDGAPRPSSFDKVVDQQLSEPFRIRSGSRYYSSLIVSPRDGGSLAFSGYVESEGGTSVPIERIWVVGERLQLWSSLDSSSTLLLPAYERNVRAFGEAIQKTIASLKIAVVGCGGTGSSIAEQLVRLGAKRLLLVDAKSLSESNVTRVYGSYPADVGRPKTAILSEHLQKIAPDGQFQTLESMVTNESTARRLIDCDVVFGCTDDNAGRLVLSRLATFFMTPVFDCGVLLTSDADGRLSGIDARVTVLTPGSACLVCRGRIDIARASAELLSPSERQIREDEGYAPALGNREPAVVAYTTAIASASIVELLERLIGYGPEPRPSEVLLRWHERAISTNIAKPVEGHYCNPAAGKIGQGLAEPFLELAWS